MMSQVAEGLELELMGGAWRAQPSGGGRWLMEDDYPAAAHCGCTARGARHKWIVNVWPTWEHDADTPVQ